MNEVEKNFKSKGTISKRFTIPVLVWEDWQEDCKNNFNDTYHLKMQYDHQYRKDMVFINLLINEIEELKERVAYLENSGNEQQTKKKTFG